MEEGVEVNTSLERVFEIVSECLNDALERIEDNYAK